ncbi:tripartite motif-containing protein 77-like [Rhynchocyon petersi]
MNDNSSPSEVTCSICRNYFLDPLTIDCGHSFCRPCLYLYWEEVSNPPNCPVCKKTCEMSLTTNIALKMQVFSARRKGLSSLQSSQEECMIHMKPKTFFCKESKDTLCMPCCNSGEHKPHKHWPIDYIAEEYRQKLLEQMRSVWENKQENQRNLNREISKITSWELLINGTHESAHEQKAQQKRHGGCPAVGGGCRYAALSPGGPSLPAPRALPTGSGWQRRHLCRDFVFLCTFLDHEGVTSNVPLFEDLKHILFYLYNLVVTHNPTRRNWFLSWGSQAFNSGISYWQADVAGCWNWVIGLCNDSWTSRKDMLVNSEGIYLLYCMRVNNNFHLFTSSPLMPQYIARPLGDVGVFLDYERGIVSFVDVAKSTLICSFRSCSFSHPLRPFFCVGPQ